MWSWTAKGLSRFGSLVPFSSLVNGKSSIWWLLVAVAVDQTLQVVLAVEGLGELEQMLVGRF
jgi:hypothetical protein